MLPVKFSPAARDDVNAAIDWYGNERRVLALAFTAALDAVVTRVRHSPLQFPKVRDAIRRALLGRFPYAVFFVVQDDRINVIAVLHLHRDPKTWMERK